MSADTPAPTRPDGTLRSAASSPPTDPGSGPLPGGGRKPIPSAALLGTATAIEIEHMGQIYRLQTTRAGKLILTK